MKTLSWVFYRHNGHLKTHKSELLSLPTVGDLREINLLVCTWCWAYWLHTAVGAVAMDQCDPVAGVIGFGEGIPLYI